MNIKKITLKKSTRFDIQRKVVAHMTSTAWKNIPHISYIYEPDITDFFKEFSLLSKEKSKLGYKISFNTILIKVITEGIAAEVYSAGILIFINRSTTSALHSAVVSDS